MLSERFRTSRTTAVLCLYALLFARSLHGQPFDFENGIPGWQQTGDAFLNQPYCGPITSTRFAPSPLGGTYWKNLPFPLGQHGSCFITTLAHPSDTPVGSLTSTKFALNPQT